MNFSQRSYKKELLDRDDLPFEDIRQNMLELDIVNKRLGGHAITLAGFRQLLSKMNSNTGTTTVVSVLEIGCGGGDNLRVIGKFCERLGLKARLSGVDLNPRCIEYARARPENSRIEFFTSDYRAFTPVEKPDIIFNSLFCHHFTDEGVSEIIGWMKEHARIGFFINDLHRHPLAYYSIRWLTRLFSKSYLVKNDGPLSVLRGFRRSELGRLARVHLQGIPHIQWRWAFRWLLLYWHE
jgi:SAM-dependent methyltransferase